MTTPQVNPGLCGRCSWAQSITSANRSTFLRCGRHDDDPAYEKYPRLPVMRCPGFEQRTVEPAPPDPTAMTIPVLAAPPQRRPAAAPPDTPPPDTPPPDPTAMAIPVVAAPPRRLPAAAPPDAPPLIERIGGPEAVARIVERFYDRIEGDPELRAVFPDDLAAGRQKQRLFLEQWLGGAAVYSERFGEPRLRLRHFPFVIDEHAAGRWLHHMCAALRESGDGEQEAAEILAGLGPLAKHMVNADDDVPREPLKDPFLA
jgi:hemoglobin